jgi:long-subunit acyl-CoA synthetase (AMP-forming)
LIITPVCLVVPDFLMLEKYAEQHGLPDDMKELVANPDVQTMITGKFKDKIEAFSA